MSTTRGGWGSGIGHLVQYLVDHLLLWTPLDITSTSRVSLLSHHLSQINTYPYCIFGSKVVASLCGVHVAAHFGLLECIQYLCFVKIMAVDIGR